MNVQTAAMADNIDVLECIEKADILLRKPRFFKQKIQQLSPPTFFLFLQCCARHFVCSRLFSNISDTTRKSCLFLTRWSWSSPCSCAQLNFLFEMCLTCIYRSIPTLIKYTCQLKISAEYFTAIAPKSVSSSACVSSAWTIVMQTNKGHLEPSLNPGSSLAFLSLAYHISLAYVNLRHATGHMKEMHKWKYWAKRVLLTDHGKQHEGWQALKRGPVRPNYQILCKICNMIGFLGMI